MSKALKTLKIVSFDPASYRNLGCAIAVVSFGDEITILDVAASTFVINLYKDEPWTCLWPLFSIVDRLLENQEPDLVIIEKTSSFAGGFVTGQVSNCLGVILACCGKYNLNVEFVYPTHVKKIVCGNGKASKSEIKANVVSLLKQLKSPNIKFDTEHAYDAVANILSFIHESDRNVAPQASGL